MHLMLNVRKCAEAAKHLIWIGEQATSRSPGFLMIMESGSVNVL